MWKSKNLSEFGDIVTGNTPSTKDPTNYGSEVPFIKPPELQTNLISGAPEMLSKKGARSARVLPSHSVMVSCIGNLGKVAINKVPVATNQQINSVIPDSTVHYKFLFYVVQSQNFRNQLESLASATTVSIVNKGNFSKVEIPVPPLPTQHRIVEKIEELFSELDNGVENLMKAQKQLKTYRQAVLKDAFEGKLTKEWRALRQAQDADDLPTPEELLRQIKAERKAHLQHELAEWEKEVEQWEKDGKPGRKPRKPSKLDIPDSPNADHELRKWKIPNNWSWTQLGMLAFVTKLAGFEYTKFVDYTDDGDLPVIKAENASENGFKRTSFSYVQSSKVSHLTRSEISGGELLVVFVGAGTGNVALVPDDRKYFLGPNIAMSRPYIDVNMKYVEYFFQSAMGKNLMMAAVKAVAQPSLNMGTIRQSPIALPSLGEQKEIVNEIESRLSVVDQLEHTIKENLQKAEALRQSILKKAFGGELGL